MYTWKGIAMMEDDAYFTRWVKQCGRLDHHQGFLQAILPYLKGTVLDLGANIGTHTHFYLQHAEHVIAVEANPPVYECLVHNCPEAKCINAAIGAESGHVSMSELSDGNYGAMYTIPGGTIPMITIDSLNLSACDFIKMDIEGAEIDGLQGGLETILKYKPIMCIECNAHTLCLQNKTPQDLINFIHYLGYTTSVRKPEDISCDLICKPK